MKKFLYLTTLIIATILILLGVDSANAQKRNRNALPRGRYLNTRSAFKYNRPYRLPFNPIKLKYGGHSYFYSNGLYYALGGRRFTIIRPPLGIRLGLLPTGYWSFNFGGFPYYYYSGVFYRSTNDHQYQVVEAPIGAEVPSLPNDAKPIIVNEQKLYEYLGTYYKEVIDDNGKRHYIVQGKGGVLNTDKMNEETPENISN